jgi:glutaredoxin
MAEIIVYGTRWCADCRRSERFLSERHIAFDWIDIDQDPEAAETVRALNHGKQVVPTIVLPDGSVLAEPDNAELALKLGLPPT